MFASWGSGRKLPMESMLLKGMLEPLPFSSWGFPVTMGEQSPPPLPTFMCCLTKGNRITRLQTKSSETVSQAFFF